MKKTLRKILASFLAAVMVLAAIPFSVIDYAEPFASKANAAETVNYEVGDIISFGSYPQSRVTDNNLINLLNGVEGNYSWTDYNYYSKNEVSKGMMYYKDIPYGDDIYRAVKINKYRDCYSFDGLMSISYQEINGYVKGEIYYFKYEPLYWKVLDPSEGYILCTKAIDAPNYQNTIYYGFDGETYYDESHTGYACDWEMSSLRAWLNNDFYKTAFSSSEKNNIKTTLNQNKSLGDSKYDGADTYDKVFVPSYDDVCNTDYGFKSDPFAENSGRKVSTTEYACCQGCRNDGYITWWLRAPVYSGLLYRAVGSDLTPDNMTLKATYYGVVPALKIKDLDSANKADKYDSWREAYYDYLSNDDWIGQDVSGSARKKMAVLDLFKDGVPEVAAVCEDSPYYTIVFLSYCNGKLVVDRQCVDWVDTSVGETVEYVNESEGRVMTGRTRGKNVKGYYELASDGLLAYIETYAVCYYSDSSYYPEEQKEYYSIMEHMEAVEYVPITGETLQHYFGNTVYTKNIVGGSDANPILKTFDYSLEHYIKQTPSTTYNPELAEVLMWFAHSAYIDDAKWTKEEPVYIARTLKSFGFPKEDIHPVNYDVDAEISTTCAYSVAKKELENGKKLIMIAVRGTGNSISLPNIHGEWLGNILVFDAGTSIGAGWHPNFELCANNIYDTLSDLDWINKSDDYIYCVTGHSKGAGVANLLSVKLSDNGIKKENLYDYNFACPDVAVGSQLGWNFNGDHDNMFNINNVCDLISYVPALLLNHFSALGMITTWGKFGVSKWFSLNWTDPKCTNLGAFIPTELGEGLIPTSYIKGYISDVKDPFINPHDQRVYLGYLAQHQNLDCMIDREVALTYATVENYLTSWVANICCPVDFTVTDKNGNIMAKCVDGKPTYYDCKDNFVLIGVYGDKKSVLVVNPEGVNINMTATDSGTLEFSVEHFGTPEGEAADKNVYYENIQLDKNKFMRFTCTEPEDLTENELCVVNEEGNAVSLINTDGTETKLNLGDINADGNINSSDALLTLQHSVGQITLTGDKFTRGDVNKDKTVNSTDALKILQYSVGQIDKF